MYPVNQSGGTCFGLVQKERRSLICIMPLKLQNAPRVALICGLTTNSDCAFQEAINILRNSFGSIVDQSEPYALKEGGYYASEMGRGLKKQLLCFMQPVAPDTLYTHKMLSIGIEHTLAEMRDGARCRRVNIDPGLLSIESLVLSTTKRVGHRISIGKGIWAETTLLYQKGAYRPLPWTYLDYQREDVQFFLLRVRQWLQVQQRSADDEKSAQ